MNSHPDATVRELARNVALLASAVSGDRTAVHRDAMLSVVETATALGVDPATVHRWISRDVNPLPAYRPPGAGDLRVKWGDVIDWYEPVNDARQAERIAGDVLRRLGSSGG